ncbi:MAG: DNA replication and repair protein RecF [Acidobacteria bacterium]|nr:DNA replication and repair protein RecF [Acidobacteriota bacterium]
MFLGSFTTRNFRNLEPGTVELIEGVNLVAGDNGEGKTNLLEAVYFLATTRSFRTSRIASLSRTGSGLIYASGDVVEGKLNRSISVGIELGPPRRRRLEVNGDAVTLHEYLRQVPVIAYSADRLAILRGGPIERRRFLDRGIAHLDPAYLEELGRFQRTVRQRNAMIQAIAESRERASALDPWDLELIRNSAQIRKSRAEFVSRLAEVVRRLIRDHGGSMPEIEIEYRPSVPEGESGDLSGLRDIRSRELRVGHTLRGAHRDELWFGTGGEIAAELLSSGQIKMLVLFLKMAKIELQIERFGSPPIFILDDVDAELDLGVIERLFLRFRNGGQILTSSAKHTVLEALNLGSHRILTISGGRVSRMRDIA